MAKIEARGSRKMLVTMFALMVLASTYLVLRYYDVIRADDASPKGRAHRVPGEGSQGAGNVTVQDSVSLYGMLEDRGCQVSRGNVSDVVVLDCGVGQLLDLAGNSGMVLLEQELECGKIYDAASGAVSYELHDRVFIYLIRDGGPYLWSAEYVHEIDEWSEAVFQRYAVPVAEAEFSEAEWMGQEILEVLGGSSKRLSDPLTGPYWEVTLKVRNMGSGVAVVSSICINDVEVSAYSASRPVDRSLAAEPALGLTISPGGSKTVKVLIDGDYGRLTTGATVNICLRCESGTDYIQLVKLG